jgi:SAM-dependent methyltransferase
MWERIPVESWRDQAGHVERYEMARDLLIDGDVVLDASCGIGYGKEVLGWESYVGVDREPVTAFSGDFRVADLDTWEPDFEFSMGLCFETLEHLREPERFCRIMLRATRVLMISVPTVPTMHMNPWHLHDFTVQDILAWLEGYQVQLIPQPHELSHIFIVTRKGGPSLSVNDPGDH